MNWTITRSVSVLLALTVLTGWSLQSGQAFAQDRTPELMPNKKTLYQRILTLPRATIADAPDAGGAGNPVPSFSSYYVYGRQPAQDGEWLEIGPDAVGTVEGWIDSRMTVPWKQQMALVFANPAGRKRNLIFQSKENLDEIWDAELPPAVVDPIRDKVLEGTAMDQVVSVEPETWVDFSKNFYLLPILEAEERYTNADEPVRLLHVASISAEDEAEADDGGEAEKPSDSSRALREFRAAVVFVVDTTISMGPYIDRTREAVRRIYDRIGSSDVASRIRFGLIAYRSNVDEVPGLEYTSKIYADPNQVTDGEAFLAEVSDLEPAKVSSSKFDEDAYAGVMLALQEIDWTTFGGRYIVLVTDAGAIDGADGLSSTKLDAEQLRVEAKEQGVAIYAMHLKTDAGKRNHPGAQAQYESLSTNDLTPKPLYYDIDAGSVDQFGKVVESLADAIVEQVAAAYSGKRVPGSALSAGDEEKQAPGDQSEQVRQDAFLIGQAMRLAYLGRVEGTEPPEFFSGWISDRDFDNPLMATTEVRVLLNRKQLNDLFLVLTDLLDELDKSQNDDALSASDFFDNLRTVATKVGVDPKDIADPTTAKLGELGLFGEYLDDLPYKSTLMAIDYDLWSSWSTAQQEQELDKIRRKLRYYRLFNEDSARWIQLNPEATADELVYPVPFDALP